MSGSASITLPAPPTVSNVAQRTLATMAAQSGVLTDYNIGSQIRTLMEAVGSVVDTQSTIDQALAFQAIVYAAFAIFGIYPLQATAANGSVLFSTATGIPATQNVVINVGTIVQTTAGIQYTTTAVAVLAQGQTSVSVPVQAVVTGAASNVLSANQLTTLVSGVAYPLVVTNSAPIDNGTNAEAPAQTLARFTAKVASLGIASPIAIANACIGVVASGASETVAYATCYEPWIMGAVGYQTAGFFMIIDNGTGTASAALIAAVTTLLNGVQSTVVNGSTVVGESGYRPAGVPFQVLAVVPVYASIVVTATLLNAALATTLEAAVNTNLQAYQTSLQFGSVAQLDQIIVAAGSALIGNISSLSVILYDSGLNPQQQITPSGIQRVIFTSITITLP